MNTVNKQPQRNIGYFTSNDIVHIFKSIKTNVQQAVGEDVMQIIINRTKRISYDFIEQYGKDDIIDQMIKDISMDIEILPGDNNDNDIHETLNTIIHSKDTVSLNDVPSNYFTNINNPDIDDTNSVDNITKTKLIKRNAYIFLDSRYRTLDTDGTVEFKWNLYRGYNNDQGAVNAYGYIKNITEIEIYPFKIPIAINDANDLTITARVNALASNRQLSIHIKEFNSQSIIAHDDRIFIYHCNSDYTSFGSQISFSSILPYRDTKAIYKFSSPIIELSTLTLSFGNPFDTLIFDPDRVNVEFIDQDPAGADLSFVTVNSVNHNIPAFVPLGINISGLVYFTNFSTVATPVIPPDAHTSVIAYVNRPEGHRSTRTGLDTFTIPQESVILIVEPIPRPVSLMYIGLKRIQLKMRIKYETDGEE